MSEKTKKPLYKKWWVWLIAVFLIGGILTAVTDQDEAEEVNKESESELEIEKPEESETEDESVQEKESSLTPEEVDELEVTLEEVLEEDRNFEDGDVYYLDDYAYDEELDLIKVRLDIRDDPFPTKEDIIYYTESIVRYMSDFTDADIRVSMTMKVDDGYVVFGRATTVSDDIKFEEDKGMQIFD